MNAEPPKRSYSGATPQIALEMARQQVARSLTHGPSPRSPLSPRRVPLPGQAPQRNKSLSLSATIGSHLAGKPRKSQKELEKLCDDDGDDLVLEDDMALFNVPMSPSLTSVGSSFAEVTRAPRPDPQPTRLSTHIPHIIPRGPHRSPNRRMPPSRSPSGNRLPSMPEGPREPDDPKPRTQSWTKAHADLSNEARQLAEALAAHEQEAKGSLRSASTPDLSRLAQEAVIPVRRESHGRRASWFKRRSTSSVELIQGVPVPETAVIDETLPDSDEKKALMSRTRPGWLPPKNKKEEEKHLREYQRMMAQSIEAGMSISSSRYPEPPRKSTLFSFKAINTHPSSPEERKYSPPRAPPSAFLRHHMRWPSHTSIRLPSTSIF